jgi:hypothetical protein
VLTVGTGMLVLAFGIVVVGLIAGPAVGPLRRPHHA